MVHVVMGVSGCGKSAIGAALADRLGLPFFDADDFHPPANTAKMAAGVPLDDHDRAPWLATLAQHIARWNHDGGAVLACSALKRRYRDALRVGHDVAFIFLDGPFALIQQRLHRRADHFMPATLLESQFAALEPPNHDPADPALVIDIDAPVSDILARIIAALDP